MIFNPVYLWIL